MPLAVVRAVAVVMLHAGWYAEALGVIVSFDCMLRIGELVGLVLRDVALPHDSVTPLPTVALRLTHTKTGPNKFVPVRSPGVSRLLSDWVVSRRVGAAPDRKVFPFSAALFRSRFVAVCGALGLAHLHFTPHSLRHGAATADALAGVRIEDILERGRWASTKSARHYVQSGRALMIQPSIPPLIGQLSSLLSVSRFLASQ
jgi:integrase